MLEAPLTESFHLGCLLTMEIMSPVCPLLNSSDMDSESLEEVEESEGQERAQWEGTLSEGGAAQHGTAQLREQAWMSCTS